jgi:transcriptional regulator with XRE-family HTH domain
MIQTIYTAKKDDLRLPPLGRRIRKLRELFDYSQESVATELGMSISGYSRIERDEVKITLDKLMIICKVLNVTMPDLIHPNENHVLANWSLSNNLSKRFENSTEDFEKLEEVYKAQVQTLKEEVSYLRDLLSKIA